MINDKFAAQMNDAEATQTLALTISQEFAAAVHPDYSFPDEEEAGSTLPRNDENQNQNTLSSWRQRQGTPFRFKQRPNSSSSTNEEWQLPSIPPAIDFQNEGLRITARARLFTIQENQYTRQGLNDENVSLNGGSSSMSSPHNRPAYTARAVAAQERRQLRRELNAREEAAFYDPAEAAGEFAKYREIAEHSSPAARNQAYWKLCGYGEENAVVAFANARPPAKGCLVRKKIAAANCATPPIGMEGTSENSLNSASDGFSTPLSSPDQLSDPSKSKKRPIDMANGAGNSDTAVGKRRVRFAPISAAEFDSDEPAQSLTPLPPKQAAQLEQQINHRKYLAEEALRAVQQQRFLTFDPELHQTTLENEAILSRWNNYDPDDDVAAEDVYHREKKQKRRSSGRFTPSPGGRSLLDDDDEIAMDEDESGGVTESQFSDDYSRDDHALDHYSDYDLLSFEGHQDSLLLESNQEHLLAHYLSMTMQPRSSFGREPSDYWRHHLRDPEMMDFWEMEELDVWNDLVLVSSLLQPPFDPDSWLQTLTLHPQLLQVWQECIIQALLESESGRLEQLSSANMAQAESHFNMERQDFQDRCLEDAELSGSRLDVQVLELLCKNLQIIKQRTDERLAALNQLETSTAEGIASSPPQIRNRLVELGARQVAKLEHDLEIENDRCHMLESQLQDMTDFLADYQLALNFKTAMIVAPCEIGEDGTGDIIWISSPIQNLSIELVRAFAEPDYCVKVTEDCEHFDQFDVLPYEVDAKHRVADFYRSLLKAIMADAQLRGFLDVQNVVDFAVTINRLRLVALDLLNVYHFHPVTILLYMEGRSIMIDIELPSERRLHIFYDMTKPRCLAWCLPSLVQVIQSDRMAMPDAPPMALYAMNASNVSACGCILSNLCQALTVDNDD